MHVSVHEICMSRLLLLYVDLKTSHGFVTDLSASHILLIKRCEHPPVKFRQAYVYDAAGQSASVHKFIGQQQQHWLHAHVHPYAHSQTLP